jgi:hypothetical protein
MQKLAGLITEGNEGSVDEVKASSLLAAKKKMTKKKLKEAIREMILNEVSEEKLDEAKKKDDKKDKDSEVEIEDINLDTEESTDTEDNIDLSTKTITPQDVQKELTDALEAAKGLGDEKLVRQIGNALTYFTRSQVSGEEGLKEAIGDGTTDKLAQAIANMSAEEKEAIMKVLGLGSKVSQKKITPPNTNPYKKSTLTRNEEFLQDIFREPFIENIKTMVIDYLDNSDINDISKKTMKYNIETINNRDRLIKYITNSVLAYEGLGVNSKKRFEE